MVQHVQIQPFLVDRLNGAARPGNSLSVQTCRAETGGENDEGGVGFRSARPSSTSLCAAAGGTRERPRSAVLSPEDHSSLTLPSSRRHTSLMGFHSNSLSKSLSISNIAGYAELPQVYVAMLDRNAVFFSLFVSLFPKFFYRPTCFFFIQSNVRRDSH